MKSILLFILLSLTTTFSLFAQHGGHAMKLVPGWDDHVTIPDNPNGFLDIQNGFTIETWIKVNGDASTEDGKFFSKATLNGNNALVSSYAIAVRFGTIFFEVFGADENAVMQMEAGTIRSNRWYHIAATYQVGGSAKIYINGRLAGEENALPGNHGINNKPLILGLAGWDLNQLVWEFNGEMDEVKFWNTPLEAVTIKEWLLRPVDQTHPNYNQLSVYLKFDESTGEMTASQSPVSANSGTFSNNAQWTASTIPFSGTYQYFASNIPVDLGGIWKDHESDESDIMKVSSGSLTDEQSVVFANDGAGYLFYDDAPSGYDMSLQKAWRMTTQGSPNVSLVFDLSPINLSMISEVVLLAANEFNFSAATVIQGTWSGNTFTVPNVLVQDGIYYTLGFKEGVTSVGELAAPALEVNISPNPSKGLFHFTVAQPTKDAVDVMVLDNMGKCIFQNTYDQAVKQYEDHINLTNAPAGVYILRIASGEKVSSKRLIIQH